MKKTISIILPFFNSEETLDETLASVFDETQRAPQFQFEIIALDDGSNDRSVEVVKSWQSKLRINLQLLHHSGTPAAARRTRCPV